MTVHRQSNTTDAVMPALVEVLEALDRPAVFPHPPPHAAALERTGLLPRAAAAATLTPPLGYLEFTALLMSAAVCLTDSGGVQKEAYLHRVPCITLRDTSEWVETVELGWNRLAGGLDAAAVTAALASLAPPGASAALRRRRCGRPHRRGCRTAPAADSILAAMTADIAIVGAGYVGLPLAVEFARVGRTVVCVDDRPAQGRGDRPRRELRRGRARSRCSPSWSTPGSFTRRPTTPPSRAPTQS